MENHRGIRVVGGMVRFALQDETVPDGKYLATVIMVAKEHVWFILKKKKRNKMKWKEEK